jgi:hypothetical protein
MLAGVFRIIGVTGGAAHFLAARLMFAVIKGLARARRNSL